MEIKILQVFLGADGLPYKDQERTVHFPIVGSGFQGASNTTKIRFYYDELVEQDDTETSWVACAKLPNGKIGSKVLETDYDSTLGEHYALLELDSFYFQYKGDVYISLQGYQGGVQVDYDEETELYTIYGTPTIAATGSIKLSVNYATQFVGSGETSNVNFQRILADLGTKLGIRDTSVFVEELPTVGNPDTFYVIHNDLSDPNKANIYIWNSVTEHYIWVGDNTLDLGEYYTKDQGEDFEEEIGSRVDAIENEFAQVNQLRPSGVDTSTNILAFTEDKGIWIGSDTGNWYYWNGTQYVSGGTYQASQIGIEAIQLAQLQSDISGNFYSINLFDKTKVISGGYYGGDGSVTANANSYYSTQYIPVKPSVVYKMSEVAGLWCIIAYDKNGNVLERIQDYQKLHMFNVGTAYIRLSIYNAAFTNNFMFCENALYPSSYQDYDLKTKVDINDVTGVNNKVLDIISVNGIEMTNITNGLLPSYAVLYPNCYASSDGTKQTDSSIDSIEITALTDFELWVNTVTGTGYVSICTYNADNWDATKFIARYRTADSNLPTSENKLSVQKGQCIVISYRITDGNFDFYVDGLLQNLLFKNVFALNQNQLNQVASNKVFVTKTGDNYDIELGNYNLHFYRYTNVSENLDTWDIYEIYKDGTLLETGNILGVVKENGQGDFMGGNNHGDDQVISMNIYCDGKTVTSSTYGSQVDIFLISYLQRPSDHSTNVFKKIIHITIANNEMIVETTFVCLVNNLSLEIAYIGMWGQMLTTVNGLYCSAYEYDVSNPQTTTLKKMNWASYYNTDGLVTITCENNIGGLFNYYVNSRIKLYYYLATGVTLNNGDILFGKASYKFS